MPDVVMMLTIRGRRVRAWTRHGNGATLSGVTVVKGKPFPPCEEQAVRRRVKHFLAKGRGLLDAWTTQGWCMGSRVKARGR